MSYGTNVRDAYRQIGIYAARLLKGAKVEAPFGCRLTPRMVAVLGDPVEIRVDGVAEHGEPPLRLPMPFFSCQPLP